MGEKPLLFPDVPALVSFEAGTLEISNLNSGWRCEATGVVARAAYVALQEQGSASSPLLQALGARHELARALTQLERQRRLELSPANALRLGGFDTLFVELTGACNERCIHCYAAASPKTCSALDRATCTAILEDAVALGFRRVQLTGGEPLLCPFFVELVQEAEQRGVPCCEIYTNGLLLTDALLARLSRDRVQLAFSFYARDPVVHDAITRTPGSQTATASAIRRAVQAGFSVRVAVVVMEQNAAQVAETIAHIKTLGAQLVSASASHGVGRGGFFSGDWCGGPQAEAGEPADHPPDLGKLCVAPDGRVLPCVFNRRDVLGQLGQGRRLRDIVEHPSLPAADDGLDFDALRAQLQCGSCRLTAVALRQCARSSGGSTPGGAPGPGRPGR